MTEHAYDHVMAWTSLLILFPLVYENNPDFEHTALAGTMVIFTYVSVQHWRHYSVRWIHALDVALAHCVFLWHLAIAYRGLQWSEWTVCIGYASISATCFLMNESWLHCRTRAVACGDQWSWFHLVPHAMFRYNAFAMVMTARRAPWTWRFVLSYVSSVGLLGVCIKKQML